MAKPHIHTATGEDAVQALKRQLLEKLLSNKFSVGSRFYSVREVAQWPEATTHLAQQALQLLCREGYLESVPKKGLFVRGGPKRDRPSPHGAWRLLALLIPPGSNRRALSEWIPTFYDLIDPDIWRLEPIYLPDDYTRQGGFPTAENVLKRHPTAIIWLMPAPTDMMMIRYFITSGIPTVTYNRDFSSTGAMGLVADVSGVVRAMFNQLYEQGRRRFAVVAVDRPSP